MFTFLHALSDGAYRQIVKDNHAELGSVKMNDTHLVNPSKIQKQRYLDMIEKLFT